MTIGEWLQNAEHRLTVSGCPDPAIDARWIAEDVLQMNRAELRFEARSDIHPDALAAMNLCLDRRAQGEPVQYILRRADFMGLRLYVDDRVLIPRQDTETLAEAVIIDLQSRKEPHMLDLCCGSGAIGLSVKSLARHVRVTLADISPDALDVARKNARDLNLDVTIRRGDLFRAVEHEKFDLIASNPPYILSGDMADLQREVQFEPASALDGGADGLDFYRRIAADAPKHLNAGGSIYLEVGEGEAGDVLEIVRTGIDCADSGVIRDLNGIERIVWARSR